MGTSIVLYTDSYRFCKIILTHTLTLPLTEDFLHFYNKKNVLGQFSVPKGQIFLDFVRFI